MAMVALWGTAGTAHAADPWQQVGESIVTALQKIPAQHQSGDTKAVEATVRTVYYEQYQVSGLEDEIKHRLGAERAAAFQSELIALRNLVREDASTEQVSAGVDALIARLTTDLADLQATPELRDRWARVAQSIVETAQESLRLYRAGQVDAAFTEASRAYLEHYEAGGLEKATLSYLSSGRVAEAESLFRQIRMDIRNGIPADTIATHVTALAELVTEDAAALDALGSGESLGWAGFMASFLILLREGAEALLVVAAVITYVVKTGRRDQLRGVYLGIGAAIAVSIALAWGFSALTSSAALGMTQELIEGVTGALAAVMLIYISSWVLSKSEGDAWQNYLDRTVEDRSSGGSWALFTVVFLAVAREGFETILFYIPVFGAAQTPADYLMVWAGLAAAVVVLAILFVIVRRFGVRLPLRPFFRWTSVLLAVLAITIAGGAVKEFQDAMLISATPVAGVPQITWLGLYPTLETLLTQALVTAVVIGLMFRRFRAGRSHPTDIHPPAEQDGHEPAPLITTKGQSQ